MSSSEELRARGIVPTIQRVAVWDFLKESKNHPTAEEIYEKLKKRYSTFSKATVYNALEVLKEAGIIQELEVEKGRAHYDPNPHPHHHFYCIQCKRIYDVEIECEVAKRGEIDGHKIEWVQACFYGICASCRRKNA